MSTGDVPGANPVNGDDLHIGCWAEHSDGSLILVEGAEGGNIVYSIFDVSRDPPVEYRDAMSEDDFKADYTQAGWTWHDKTAFPWERIMRVFPSGQKDVSIGHTLTAAQELANRRSLRGVQMAQDDISHRTDQPMTPPQRDIMGRIQNALDAAAKSWSGRG